MIEMVVDPSTRESENCQICGEICWQGCLCPECEECGIAGDPGCIVTHMPVSAWKESLYNLADIIEKNPDVYEWLHPTVKIFMDSQILPASFMNTRKRSGNSSGTANCPARKDILSHGEKWFVKRSDFEPMKRILSEPPKRTGRPKKY